MRNDWTDKVESLRKNYDQNLLLEVTKEYATLLHRDNIEINLWIDAIEERLHALSEGETTIDSLLDDCITTADNYEHVLNQAKQEVEEKKWVHFSFLTGPVFFLQIVYMYNHPTYEEPDDMWDFEGQNQPFVDVLEAAKKSEEG